ncbi:hypothetical protein, partial [Neisseria dumasiana]|uniref:hypothetical protein n=1 Tax=Neisseria dumasiana TaxID=1931275 RepID=UPI001E533AC3
VSFVLGQLCVAHMQSFLQERPYATAYWPFSVVESCTSNLNPLASPVFFAPPHLYHFDFY